MRYLPAITESVSRRGEVLGESLMSGLSSTVSKLNEMKTNLLFSIKHSGLPLPLVQRREIVLRDDKS